MTAGLLSFGHLPNPLAQGWFPLKIGAGGYVPRADIAPDGTMVCGTDNYGAYYYDRTVPCSGNAANGALGEWVPLTTADRLGITWDYPGDTQAGWGCYDIVIAHSNTQRFYMLTGNCMWRSDNRGASWTKLTGFGTSTADPNGNYRVQGKYIAVDPANADVVFVTTPDNGVQYSTDAGAYWTTILTASIPACSANTFYSVAFDPSTTSGVNTKGVFVGSYGHGIYYTSDYTGGSWAPTTSSPTTITCLVVSSTGIAYLVDDSYSAGSWAGNIWRYTSGSWAQVKAYTGVNPSFLAIDPSDATKIWCSCNNNETGMLYSGDAGATWGTGGHQTVTPTSPDVPWLVPAGGELLGSGLIMFDPSRSPRTLMQFTGLCAAKIVNPPMDSTTGFTRTSMTTGIEEMTQNWAVHPPGGNLIDANYDRAIFTLTPKTTFAQEVYPSTYSPSGTFNVCWSVDYAHGTDTVVSLSSFYAGDVSGISNNKGITWTKFSDLGTIPPFAGTTGGGWGGGIAAASATNFVMVRGDDGTNPNQPYYTTNGGTSWAACTFGSPTPPTSGTTGWGAGSIWLQQILCADRVDANTFYMFNNLAAGSGGGLWKSTDGGANWARVNVSDLASGYTSRLQSVPSNAGHLFYSAGGPSGSLMRSTDHGSTWAAVTNVTAVWCIGFGPVASGQSYPSIAFIGKYNGVWGTYRTIDNFTSVQALGPTPMPLGYLEYPIWIVPDPDVYGIYRMGFKGTGVIQGYFP